MAKEKVGRFSKIGLRIALVLVFADICLAAALLVRNMSREDPEDADPKEVQVAEQEVLDTSDDQPPVKDENQEAVPPEPVIKNTPAMEPIADPETGTLEYIFDPFPGEAVAPGKTPD